jgi:predicted dienelactone hydrolase
MKTQRMKPHLIALALTLSAFAVAAEERPGEEGQGKDRPGFATFQIRETSVAQPMQAAVWYPGSGGKPFEIGNAVFEGVPVQQDAQAQPGKHPVVLLSHGLGGNYRSLAWLGAGLARHGAIVIAVSHPNSSTGDVQMTKAFDHWTRGQDLSKALEVIEADPRFAGVVNPDRIYAAGFSFGGWTALSMAGVRGNIGGFADYCAARGKDSTHCHDIAKWGVNLRGLDAAAWNASYKDARIKAVAAIDPAFTFGIDAKGVSDVTSKVLMIGLGTGADRLAATDFSENGSDFGNIFATAQKLLLAPAYHFTALLTCRPEGAAILAAENDDPVCTDPVGADRKAVHEAIIAAMARHFDLK